MDEDHDLKKIWHLHTPYTSKKMVKRLDKPSFFSYFKCDIISWEHSDLCSIVNCSIMMKYVDHLSQTELIKSLNDNRNNTKQKRTVSYPHLAVKDFIRI